MQEQAITTISLSDLPEGLNRLHKPPKSLNTLGDIRLLRKKPRVGIVGSRKFSPYGKEVTEQISSKLARAGVTVVSGLALGVDSIAHKACLDAGGSTIAILPSGLRNIYPASHSGLAKHIVKQNGLLVSEYPDKFRPFKASFLERNRIIAAFSDILVITEAARASGSLNTANHALEMGISVMAVPGNISSPYSEGANRLIKAGAEPITNPQDILDNLGIHEAHFQKEYLPENKAEQGVLSAIKAGRSTTNEIVASSGLSIGEVQITLSMLEIKGALSVQAGNWSIS